MRSFKSQNFVIEEPIEKVAVTNIFELDDKDF